MLTTLGLTLLGGLLNRTRGAWFRIYIWDSGVAARFAWAIPTALLLWFGTTPNLEFAENPYRIFLLVLSCWAMWWPGSGAHSVMNFDLWKQQWDKGNLPDDTEAYSKWILLKLFKQSPDPLSTEEFFLNYHVVGKSIEGVLRLSIMVAPICILAPYESLILVCSGALWGLLFNLGWSLTNTKGWTYGEILTGAITYATIGAMFYAG